MLRKSPLVLPCDPEYTAHREAQKRRQETREWLLQRERASVAPSIVPDASKGEPKVERRRRSSITRRRVRATPFIS
jgi:hypothetical protein